MGNPEFTDFDALIGTLPPPQYDSLVHEYIGLSGSPTLSIPPSSWANRAVFDYNAFVLATSTIPRPSKSPKKYKPVHRRFRPVPTYMPDPRAQQFTEIPEMPPLTLPTHPPARSTLSLNARMTRDRLDRLLATVEQDFLSSDELDLLAFIAVSYSNAFAWEYDEKGFFDPQYFPDYKIPYVEHTPWQTPPIPLPHAVRAAVRDEVRRFEMLGRFEPSTAAYRSPLWFVQKKPGSIPPVRLVIAVEELNAVTVRDASLPPNINDFAESFVGHAIYMAADMYSGFDARILDVSSRPLGTFHSPDGPKQQTTLIQGYTNSIQEFSRCTDHVLKRLKARDWADNFVDDCGIKGPTTRYGDLAIPENPHIRRFVFEFAARVASFLAALVAGGITISGVKTTLACSRLKIVGSLVSLDGWQVGPGLVEKVLRWPVPESVSEVRMFLGLAGGARRWIRNYSRIAWPLTALLSCPPDEFCITRDVEEAIAELKKCLTSAPVLVRVDYDLATSITRPPRSSDDGMLVVGVDSSWMGAGWVLYQVVDGIKRPALYGSSTFTKTQQNYGQPKSEVFGTFIALKALRHRVWGVHFRLEHDAVSLAKMIKKPDDVPNAPMLRWVSWLLLFDFETKHVPATAMKMEDALSRAPPIDTGLPDPSDDVDDFLDRYGLHATASSAVANPATFSCYHSILRSLQLTHANPFTVSSQYVSSPPLLSSSTALAFQPGERFNPASPSLLSAAPASLLAVASLAHIHGLNYRRTDEFFIRAVVTYSPMQFYLAGNLMEVDVPFTLRFSEPLSPDDLAIAAAGHRFGSKDKDDVSYWDELRLFLSSGDLPSRLLTDNDCLAFQRRARRFLLHDGRLWLAPKRNSPASPHLVIEDQERRRSLMLDAHLAAGHRGRDATHKLLLDRFYWPNMWDDVSFFVRSCIECQRAMKAKPVLPYNESWLSPLLRHFDLDTIHMPMGMGKKQYVIQALERTILWPEARAIKNANSRTVAQFIYEDIVCRFSCVPVITVDLGSEFLGEVQHLLRTLYRCTVIFSTAYHPEGNAPVERSHNTLTTSLFKVTGDAKGRWPLYLAPVLFAMRTTVSRATGYSPYYLLYGQHPVFSYDIEEITWQTLDWDQVYSHEDLIAMRARQIQRRDVNLEKAHDRLRASRKKAIEDYARRHHYKFDFADYEEGMYVWLRESKLDEIKGGKGEWTYAGPYIIHEKRDHDSFVLRELSGAVLKGHVNIRRLRLFFFRPDNQTLRARVRTPPEHDARHTNPLSTLAAVYAYRTRHGPI